MNFQSREEKSQKDSNQGNKLAEETHECSPETFLDFVRKLN